MSLRDELEAIRKRNGKLTPAAVLAEARNESHPLHSRFEWDDSVAAERYRLEQAHELIQSVRISYGPKKEGRGYQYVSTRAAYEPTEEVVRDPLTAQIVMQDMKREWTTLKRRYSDFHEFWQMVQADAEEAAA